MIRQAAFGGTIPLLKGGLHCHTTRSDGDGSPEEVILRHGELGYDFLALTDHRLYNHANYAPQAGILILPGCEVDHNIGEYEGLHCFHTVFVGPSISDGNGYGQDQVISRGTVADQFAYQPYLDEIHKNHNLTIYCHPQWSGTPAREFEGLQGNFAMEIWNTGCALENEMDDNAAYWDELLMQGIHISGVATDDGHKMDHHGRGWVMVNARRELNDILRALEHGAFYATCGPQINDFYIDGDLAVVECSPCATIYFHYGRYPTQLFSNPGGSITRAEYHLPAFYRYLRISVKDQQGRRAWSNPIYLENS